MENDNIEIIDYLRIIWKRKILIIVGVLVGIVAGLVMNLRQELYRAEILISIGKKVSLLTTSTSASFSLVPFDYPGNLIKTIPAKYGLYEKESGKSSLNVELVSGTELIKITAEGLTRKKAEESLNEFVKRLIDDHSRIIDDSIRPLRDAIEKQKAYQNVVIDEVARSERWLNELESDNDNIANATAIIVAEDSLWRNRTSLRDIEERLMIYQLVLNNAGEYRSKIIGNVNITTIYSNYVIKVGGLGLVISILLAFFIEYIERTKKIEREKKGDTVLR